MCNAQAHTHIWTNMVPAVFIALKSIPHLINKMLSYNWYQTSKDHSPFIVSLSVSNGPVHCLQQN